MAEREPVLTVRPRYTIFLILTTIFIFLLVSTIWAIFLDLAGSPQKAGHITRRPASY